MRGQLCSRISLVGGLLAAVLIPWQATSGLAAATRSSSPPPVVIAVVEHGGMNILHEDFRAASSIALPPALPRAETIRLPRSGSFSAKLSKLSSGPLASTTPGKLYRVVGTRIVGIFTSEEAEPMNILADRFHATGTTSSAVGLEHGTDPDSFLVFVADDSPAAWRWLSNQKWIDIVSTSYFGFSSDTGLCGIRPFVKKIIGSGRQVFSAAGNSESIGPLFEPAGIPETYQVGGVDDEGRPYLPSAESQGTTSRPYETGDRFEFEAASADNTSGSMAFGGTSGATPSTAGRAATLIRLARTILGSRYTGTRGGALARATSGADIPSVGPLSDGDFTVTELVQVLHHVAIPVTPEAPARYLYEGYGALNDPAAIATARDVLLGMKELVPRTQDNAMHDRVEELRRAAWGAARCS